MKILTIAAGRGSRVQNEIYIPKALVKVQGKTLLEWSIDSFHAIRSQGLVKTEDLIFVFLRADVEKFDLEAVIATSIGDGAKIVILEALTSGPAETAAFAIDKLVQDNLIMSGEAIIINDCDHHFRSDSMVRIFNAKEEIHNKIIIFETEKDADDLSWSFVKRDLGRIVGIVEKPCLENIREIDASLGVVGLYYFSKVSRFRELFKSSILNPAKKEIYISDLINCAISERVDHDVVASKVYEFVPLGSHVQIEKALTGHQLFQKFKESPTIFFDLDGTLVDHDSSKSLGSGIYRKIKFLNDSTLMALNRLYAAGNIIILTTARSEASRDSLKGELSEKGVSYDQLIMGLSGGARVLINDTKPSLPGLPTAWSMNTRRNECSMDRVTSLITKIKELRLVHEFPNESGESTVLLESNGKRFVRKISQSTEASKELIEYQAEWLKIVREFLPDMVPRVLNLEVSVNNEYGFYDMEYVANLNPFGEHIFNADVSESQEMISKLVTSLQTIYTTFSSSENLDMSEVIEIVDEKVVPGIEKSLYALNFDLDLDKFPLRVNCEPVFNVLKDVKAYLTKDNTALMNILKSETYSPTLIHGDPTLSNIMMGDDQKIYLLDPIGTRVLPKFNYAKEGLGRCNPIYDHSRIRLSLFDEYEKWGSELVISGSGSRTEVTFAKNTSALGLYKYFDATWSELNSTKNSIIKDIVYFTTLARILPYKARGKEKEAFYILYLLSKEWDKIKKKII